MTNDNNRGRLVTIAQAILLGIVAGLIGYAIIGFVLRASAHAQGPPDAASRDRAARGAGGPPSDGQPMFRGPGGPGGEERKIVGMFDKNGDKRLDTAERKAARDFLAANPGRGFGRRGGFGGRGMATGSPGPKVSPADARSYAGAPLYDLTTLRTIFLQFENADWEAELGAFHNTDVEVPATVTIDGATYKDVGVHFRGMSSFMMVSEGSKRSLNLTFDDVDEKQNVGGYRTLNLLNGNGDPTFIRPVLYSEISREYIATPRMNYVRVVINGESWGVYINAQQFNKDFTRDYFKSTKGARWKVPGSPGGRGGMEYLGDDPSAYKRLYEIKTKDDPTSWAALIRMFRVLNETPPERLEAELAPLLDLDGVLEFLALDVALVNSDGYWARGSDYSIYQDERGRFHVIPHDVNEGLSEEGGRGGPPPGFGPPPGGRGFPPDGDGPPPPPPGGRRGRGMFGPAGGVDLDPLVGLDDATKPLRSKLLAVPALRARYLGYVREIAERSLDWNAIGPRVLAWQALIRNEVKADTRKLYSNEAFERGLADSEDSLKHFIQRRREFLLKQLK